MANRTTLRINMSFAVIMGEKEIDANSYSLKNLVTGASNTRL
jgi:histidyl-tRNA synthetase